MLRATVERRFKHSSGEWRSTNSLSRDEISLAKYCLDKALDYIIKRQTDKQPVPEEEVR